LLDADSCLPLERLTPSRSYVFFKKVEGDAAATEIFYQDRLAVGPSFTPATSFTNDFGESIHRFAPITFPHMGEFKVCLCDSALSAALAPGQRRSCATPGDFSIEVGTVHVSGVYCLLNNERLRRGECVGQAHGGLRCYPAGTVPVVRSPFAAGDNDDELEALVRYCRYGLPEAAARIPFCQRREELGAGVAAGTAASV